MTVDITFRRSFAQVMQRRDAFAERFYELYFEANPAVVPLFRKTQMPELRRKMTSSLIHLLGVEHDESARDQVRELARKHIGYRVEAAHFDGFAASFLQAVAEVDPDNAAEATPTWTRLLTTTAELFLEELQAS